MGLFELRKIKDSDRAWITGFLTKHWGSAIIVSRGNVHQADMLPGFVAMKGHNPIGLITYNIVDSECEIVSLNSEDEGIGVGTSILDAAKIEAASCRRLWLITTNDNLRALSFYQKRGFRLKSLYPGAIEISRRLKPEIPEIGLNGISIRDEIELELIL